MKKYSLMLILLLALVKAGSADSIGIAADPIRLGVGARPLGMGKAFVGMADDTSSIFLNPAGLGRLKCISGTTMAGKFVSEVDYNTFGLVYPLGRGAIGVGYVGAGIGAVMRTSTIEVVDDQYFIIPTTNEASNYSFADRTILLSYGLPVRSDLFLGANLKFFLVDLSGPGITGGNAKGNELDLGLLYNPNEKFSLGLNAQNILPFNLGGKLVYSSNHEESVPAVLKLGSRVSPRSDLNLLLDYDLTLRGIPGLLHLGLEWKPILMLALRAGIDQEMVGNAAGGLSAASNLTAGLGFAYRGFNFDYAYHQYQDFRENDTHYFSLSYTLPPEIKEKLKVFEPPDKSIIYDEKLMLKGKVLDPDKIKEVRVGGVKTALLKDDLFEREIFPRISKNKIMVEGKNGQGRVLAAIPVRLLRLRSFKDVYSGYWTKLSIEYLATLGVVNGYPNGNFKPEGNITRAEMCTILMRSDVRVTTSEAGSKFKDLNIKHWAYEFISKAAQSGIVKGYPGGTFKPNNNVTRAEGVSIIARFAGLPLTRVKESPFPDLAGRYWAVKEVNAAREAGLLKYLEGASFEANKPLTRAEAAEMLAKTSILAARISDLLNFDSY